MSDGGWDRAREAALTAASVYGSTDLPGSGIASLVGTTNDSVTAATDDSWRNQVSAGIGLAAELGTLAPAAASLLGAEGPMLAAATGLGATSQLTGAGLMGLAVGTTSRNLGQDGADLGWLGQREVTDQRGFDPNATRESNVNRSTEDIAIELGTDVNHTIDDLTGTDLPGDIYGGLATLNASVMAAPVGSAMGVVSHGADAISAIASW